MTRHPLRRRAVLAAIIAEVLLVAAAFGVAPETVGLVEVVAGSLLTVLTLAGLVASAEPVVTPVDDPRNDRGEELVPVGQVELMVAANGHLRRLLEQHGIDLDARPPDVGPSFGPGH